ncbi:nucleotidyltransferase family protein [Brevundimonas goettingensis]|uniref:Nucleotidyltransferase family protein n=1 Tax=Brevundimonas goettingensis TaxID=2774190 RepID=A0A975GXF0_9CAUL|nr:nucleotidyltransferase family protein [Brevundimonas goettingensis]QTC92814.1 nucleotidyltransferase family protein [Brevundimonas goettingensis]
MTAGRHAVVLAAGAASRFGGGKLTAHWRGEPLIRWAVRAALAARVESVVLVVGALAGTVQDAVSDLAAPRLKIVEAADWTEGLSASLKAGLTALPDDAAAVAIFLGDMPEVDPGLADRLLDLVSDRAPAARARAPQGLAHPTAFAASTFPALMALTGDQGGRPVLEALGHAVATLDVEAPGATFDVDRPEDLSRPS